MFSCSCNADAAGGQPIAGADREGGVRMRVEEVLLNRTFGSTRLDVLLLAH